MGAGKSAYGTFKKIVIFLENILEMLSSNITAGLISGLLATFIVLVISKLWSKVVEPWFEERVYKDLHVEGKWHSLYINSGFYRQESINLSRVGHRIEGTMICKNGPDDGEEYILSGSFRNMLIPLTYEAKDKSKSDRGTITLKCVHNGERLEGRVSMYNTFNDTINTAFVVWFRKKSDLDKQIKYLEAHKEQLEGMKERSDKASDELKEFFETYWETFKKEKQREKESTIESSAKVIKTKD